MKPLRFLFASLLTLLACHRVPAADPKPINRVLAILEVESEDPVGYATWLKQYNDIAKAKLNVDSYLRVYQTLFDGQSSGRLRVVVSAASVAEMMKQSEALEADPGIVQNRDHLRAIRKTGARVLYQAVHFEGPTARGVYNYSTLAMVTDEAAYLKAIADLRAVFDANGLKDAKIGVYRVIAGRSDHSHRITISLPSSQRLAFFLDQISANPAMGAWLANSAKLRTVVASTTSREITR